MKSLHRAVYRVLIFMMALPGSLGYADDYHYVNMLVGDRAIGLGGAYTAVSDDPAGCYYNPAGIALVPLSGLSASANAFYRSLKSYKSAMADVEGNTINWDQESFSILPNFFGVVKKYGNGTIGFSYAVADSIQRRQKQDFQNIESNLTDNYIEVLTININDNDKTYYCGPSYAYRLSDFLSVGGTLYFYYRDKELIRNQLLIFEDGQHYLINYYETGVDFGIKPSLGIIWEPYDRIAVGFTFSKIYISSSDNETQLIYRDTTSTDPDTTGSAAYDFSDTNTIYFGTSENTTTGEFPVTYSLGLAYFVSSTFLVSGDMVYSEQVKEKESVLNFFVGMEYYFSENVAVRAGLYSDYSNTASLSTNRANQSEHVDIYGSTISLTYFRGTAGITLGFLYGFGKGDAQIVSNSTTIQDVDIDNIAVFLSAAYSY